MSNKIIFLVNPISGTDNKAGLRSVIHSVLATENIDHEFMPTDPAGEYAHLKKKIVDEQIRRLVIVGGDGTVSQCISALRDLHIEFGIIPAGSGNGFARAANISRNPLEALKTAIHKEASPIDAFMINGHFSCMLSGTGFDAQVAHDFARMKKRGLWTYIRISASHFLDAVEYPFVLKIDGKEIHTEAYFICIANGNQFGNNFTIAPKASLNDGLLDIIVVQKMNKLQVLASVFYQMKYGDVQESVFKKQGVLIA
jgi:diacylglycerol kinase (ATP)